MADTGRVIARTVFGAGLIATTIELVVYGVADVTGALTYAGRLGGFACLAAALVVIAAFIAFLDYLRDNAAKRSGSLFLAAVLICLLFNILLLVLQIDGWGYTPYLWFWVFLIPWSGWALWRLHKVKVWSNLPHPRGFTAAVVVTAAVTVGSFAYSHLYQPYKFPALVLTTVEFDRATVVKGAVNLQVRVRTKNQGEVALYVAASHYQVVGRRRAYVPDARPAEKLQNDHDLGQADLMRHTDVRDKAFVVLNQGSHLLRGRLLEPGAESVTEKVVQFPANAQFDVIAAKSNVLTFRADRATPAEDLNLSEATTWQDSGEAPRLASQPDWVVGDDAWHAIRYRARITHSSALLERSRSPHYVTVWWVLQQPPTEHTWGPRLEYLIAPAGAERAQPTAPERRRIIEQYGLVDTPSGTVLRPLPALLDGARTPE